MIQIDDTIVSELLLEKKFVCNLKKCKGSCCVEGDAGAPLEKDELIKLKEVYPHVRGYLSDNSKKALDKELYTLDEDGDYVTTLINNKECAYVVFDEDGTSKCGIEQAYIDGKIDWKKPISCHLFPVRLQEYKTFTAVNYAYWDICDDACVLGEQLGVKVYQFLKEPLVRKFGEKWFEELELIDKNSNNI